MSDAEVVKELAREAKLLMENRAFKVAVAALKLRWQNQLERNSADDVALGTVYRMRVLNDVVQELQHLINDEKMQNARRV